MSQPYHMSDATLVTLIVASDDGPLQVDVAASIRPLDPEDPRRPGDIIWHDADTDREAFITGLEAAARALRDAR